MRRREVIVYDHDLLLAGGAYATYELLLVGTGYAMPGARIQRCDEPWNRRVVFTVDTPEGSPQRGQ